MYVLCDRPEADSYRAANAVSCLIGYRFLLHYELRQRDHELSQLAKGWPGSRGVMKACSGSRVCRRPRLEKDSFDKRQWMIPTRVRNNKRSCLFSPKSRFSR